MRLDDEMSVSGIRLRGRGPSNIRRYRRSLWKTTVSGCGRCIRRSSLPRWLTDARGLSHLHSSRNSSAVVAEELTREREYERERTKLVLRVFVCKIGVSPLAERVASRLLVSSHALTRPSFYSAIFNVRCLLPHSIWNGLSCTAGTALAILSSFSVHGSGGTISRRYPLHVGARDNPK